jgi:UDP-3-O-[3-hydroxymyristoyl] glucosamine N-acyltransferase
MPALDRTARDVAELIGAEVTGDGSVTLERLLPLREAGKNDLTFADERRAGELAECPAAAAVVAAGADVDGAGKTLLRVPSVQAAVAALLSEVAPAEDLPPVGVHPTAVVDASAVLGEAVAVGPGVVIAAKANIGDRSVLQAGVRIGRSAQIGSDCILAEGAVVRYECVVGKRCRIGPNSVVGYDGFGYYQQDGKHNRIVHAGNVVLEDDVDLGACTCIDRAKFGSTVLGAGTKVDNLVQVAHNVRTGRGCILVAQAGLAGSVRLGDYVMIGGHSGLRDNITLGDGVQVAAYSAVAQDVAAGESVLWIPARPNHEARKTIIATRKLPELVQEVRRLRARLEKLESAEDH